MLDLTQKELAQRAGCSVVALQKIERDERRPSRQLAERLADFLEVPPDQRALLLKVARGERMVEALPSVPQPAPPSLKESNPTHRV
jgi:transcriptional regulator with XRE-family HTH domain